MIQTFVLVFRRDSPQLCRLACGGDLSPFVGTLCGEAFAGQRGFDILALSDPEGDAMSTTGGLPDSTDRSHERSGVGETQARLIRVGAVDDHPALLIGLKAALEAPPHRIRLVGWATTVTGLLDQPVDFDVVMLDLRLRDGSRPGTNVLRLKKLGVPILIYTEGASPLWVEEAIAAGADGVIRKDRSIEVLAEALHTLAAMGAFDSVEIARALDAVPDLGPKLSEREKQTLTLYASGLPMKVVARQLGIGIETAREYLKRVKAKYRASDRAAYTRMDLYRRAVEDGYMDPAGSVGP